MTASGRRTRRVTVDEIRRVGRELGLRRLSMTAVAAELGVSTTALYRYVDGRWGLEQLVGESVLAELSFDVDPTHDPERHLLSFGFQLHEFVLAHPGLGTYIQTLFPRGESGRRLMEQQVVALARFGYSPDVAVSIASAVAGLAVNYAVAEQAQLDRADGIDDRRRDVSDQLHSDARLAEAHREIPEIDYREFSKLVLTASIRGLVSAAPPGRPLDRIVTDLASTGMEL